MSCSRSVSPRLAGLLPTLLLLFSTAARADLDASLPPSANHDLSHWKLTLPVDALGGVSGTAVEISDLRDYRSPYFFTAADGSTVFRAAVNGASTKNSDYPRSELREMLDPTRGSVNWSDSGQSILEAQLRVNRVPVTGKLVIGQVHGFDSAPLIKLQYEFKSGVGKLWALINVTPTATAPLKLPLASGVALNQAFYYRIKVANRQLSVSVNGAAPVTHAIDPSWQNVGFYFKAGAYVQASGSSADDYGQASFYRLTATHPNNHLAILDQELPAAAGHAYYSQALVSIGGLGSLSWNLASGRLPQGLVLDPVSGIISGSPSAAVSDGKLHSFTVQARDAIGNTAARKLSLMIALPPS